jgi:pimeloyl-ACP methyl ester carboxylesterase
MNSRTLSVPRRSVLTALAAVPASVVGAAATGFDPKSADAMSRFDVRYRTLTVGDVDVFFRDAGPADEPAILLLHGFPTTSHMFRNLVPELADRFRVIAPDLPGFGRTKSPPRDRFEYSFDNLAKVVGDFVDHLGLTRYALYVFDYGAPTWFSWLWLILNALRRLSLRMATPTSKGSAKTGRHGRPTGANRPPNIAKPAARP